MGVWPWSHQSADRSVLNGAPCLKLSMVVSHTHSLFSKAGAWLSGVVWHQHFGIYSFSCKKQDESSHVTGSVHCVFQKIAAQSCVEIHSNTQCKFFRTMPNGTWGAYEKQMMEQLHWTRLVYYTRPSTQTTVNQVVVVCANQGLSLAGLSETVSLFPGLQIRRLKPLQVMKVEFEFNSLISEAQWLQLKKSLKICR